MSTWALSWGDEWDSRPWVPGGMHISVEAKSSQDPGSHRDLGFCAHCCDPALLSPLTNPLHHGGDNPPWLLAS